MDSSATNIYSAIRRFFNNNANMPSDSTGVFFQASGAGYAGCRKNVLISTIEALKKIGGWLDAPDNASRIAIFDYVSNQVGVAAQADPEGIKKFCYWVFTAANGVPEIYNYFSTPDSKYTLIDDIISIVTTDVSNRVDTIKENVDYIVTPSSTTSIVRINPLVKWAIIGTAAFIIIRKIIK